MNVNVQEHQRNILAALGIDLWIPKHGVPVRQYPKTLYRDTAAKEIISDVQFKIEPEHIEQVKQKEPVQNKILNVPEHIVSRVITPEVAEPVLVPQQDTIVESKVEPFQLQAFCLESCVIVVDATHIQAEQQQLWMNIQNAMSGEYFELKWPFPLTQFQDGRGAQIYIQGFLAALKQDKVILTLGSIGYLQNDESIQLASLAEMLAQPLLKRRLWGFMQSKAKMSNID